MPGPAERQVLNHELARATLQRYLALCDVPPESTDEFALRGVFTEDAVWEGVGHPNAAQFGRVVGADAIVAMLRQRIVADRTFVANTHLLNRGCSQRTAQTMTSAWSMVRISSYPNDVPDITLTGLRVDFRIRDTTRICLYQPRRLWSAELTETAARAALATMRPDLLSERRTRV